jgi:hypothetical protein
LYYSIAGATASCDFYYYVSADGENFVKKSYSIKNVATVGSDVIVFSPQACEAIKIEIVSNGVGDATVTCSLVIRTGVFGDLGFLTLDGGTKSLQTIDYSHHEIHAGSYFTAMHTGDAKNDGETITIYLKTSNTTKYCHCFAKWSSGGAAYFRIYEAPTITANTGTNGQVVINHSRNSSGASTVYDNATTPVVNKYGIDVTKTGDGTIVWLDYSGAGKSSAGSSRNEDEIILKTNTAYLFMVESDAAGISLNLIVSWYEHINR